ncbi:hypothetical protein TraAM80_02239 [Trypanosoma rangeli]|uniref:RING-type domain-containing protein n=1 Tax=Trypanosoma rangeli TaxID=5698 RepID=A0A422NV73_TRYRA|nr:uncharacterized protein TraAM80_02239 [Trypanosoma rangeli]RNF09365.1 hypothetical protein TraAM80_02239 [Trypanosoma rangeli]|eukprot:RNF09365.1 hypothetical protein TraAM80_02239 [Trypanosoma rangeli]
MTTLSEDDKLLFVAAREAQLTRNEAVQIIMSDVPHNVLHGAFIRVLLELQDRREDYIVARVGAITTGEVYGGFSTNANIRTDHYLVLQLPPHLAQINGTQYQLNSISNSAMTEMEFARWLEMAQASPPPPPPPPYNGGEGGAVAGSPIPTRQELVHVARRLRGVLGGGARHGASVHRQRQPNQVQQCPHPHLHNAMPPNPPDGVQQVLSTSQSQLAPQSGSNHCTFDSAEFPADPAFHNCAVAQFKRQGTLASLNAATARNCGNHSTNNNNNSSSTGTSGVEVSGSGGQKRFFHGGASPRPLSLQAHSAVDLTLAEQEFELPDYRQIRQDIINKMSQTSVLFPTNINELKVSQLRLTERDMIEYLEHVREAILSKQDNCVVCMDHVPTVISLPCRHKVLCRLCAPSVSTCPVCRSQLFELFEPKEI